RTLQTHDHTGVVFQPQIAAARRAETGLAGALCISAWKIGDAGELIDGSGSADLLNAATGARNRAYKLEWVGTPLVFQRTAAAAQAGNEVLGDRHVTRGRQARDALRGGSSHTGAAGYREYGCHKSRFERRDGTIKRCFCHNGKTSCIHFAHP